MVGSLFSGPIQDYVRAVAQSLFFTYSSFMLKKGGRRFGMRVGASVIMIGAAIITSSFSRQQFMVGRFILGFGRENTLLLLRWRLCEGNYQVSRSRLLQRRLMDWRLRLLNGAHVSSDYTTPSFIQVGSSIFLPICRRLLTRTPARIYHRDWHRLWDGQSGWIDRLVSILSLLCKFRSLNSLHDTGVSLLGCRSGPLSWSLSLPFSSLRSGGHLLCGPYSLLT